MKSSKILSLVAIISLVVCIISAIIAAEGSGSGWDSLGRAAWITVLVTIPAFSIFAATTLVLAIVTVKKWLKARLK